MRSGIVFIVDGYSTGRHYAPRLAERGFGCVHVQSQTQVPSFYSASFNSQHYLESIKFTDYHDCLEKLSLYARDPAYIIAGSEPGVELGDKLSNYFGTLGNDPATSLVRRNKFLMGEALKVHNVLAAQQFLASSPQEAVAHAQTIGKPIVIKPVDSAGSDDVTFCYDSSSVFFEADRILGKTNKLNTKNDQVLIQEKLEGEQYIVNSISIEGQHYFTEVWNDRRITVSGAGNIYDREVLMDITDAIPSLLKSYVEKVLASLSVVNGPCHTEVMLTKDGPRLIEVSSRLQGSILPAAMEAATGQSHLSSHIESLLHPKLFRGKHEACPEGRPNLNLMSVSLISAVTGTVTSTRYEWLLSRLETFYDVIGTPSMGDPISKTIDLFSSPGTVYLVSDSADAIEEDYQTIRQWEREGQLIDVR